MSKRFITDNKNITKVDNVIKITGDEVHHINVLRYNVKDKVYINEYEIEIMSISKEELIGKIVGKLEKKGEPRVNITLVQSYLKSDKMDYVVQKAVELGVKVIIPVITKNTVVKFEEKDKSKKKERLQKIVKEAIEQCGRTDEVEVLDIVSIKQIDFKVFDYVLVCHETSNERLKETINALKDKGKIKNIAVIIGPEGGLDEMDIKEILKLDNAKTVSLGERILRAETASFNILSILGYEFN